MIYFVEAEDGTIKIGTTIRLAERMKSLGATVEGTLRLLGITDGGFEEEGELHRRFDHLRLKPTRKCEWFRRGADLLDFISSEGRPWQPSDDAPVKPLANVFVLRGTDEWAAWLKEVAEANGAPLTITIEQALKEFAAKLGAPKPPRRTGGGEQ